MPLADDSPPDRVRQETAQITEGHAPEHQIRIHAASPPGDAAYARAATRAPDSLSLPVTFRD
jgi:hypothetical protein